MLSAIAPYAHSDYAELEVAHDGQSLDEAADIESPKVALLESLKSKSIYTDECEDFYHRLLNFKKGVIPLKILGIRYYNELSFSAVDNTGMKWNTNAFYDPKLKGLYTPLGNRNHSKEVVVQYIIQSKKEMRSKIANASNIIIEYYEEFMKKSIAKYGAVYDFGEIEDILTAPPPYRFHYEFANSYIGDVTWRRGNWEFNFDDAIHCLATYRDLGSLYIGIKCKKHDRFTVTANRHLKNGFCPVCKKLLLRISSGAQVVKDTLTTMGIAFEQEYSLKKLGATKSPSRLSFDFYIPSLSAAIEYDGEQHYKPVEYWGGDEALRKNQERDAIKDAFCGLNKISLLRIPYTSSTVSRDVYKFITALDL